MRHPPEAMKGLTPLLVLDALARGELSGIDIIRRIRESTEDGIEIAEGTIYPLLYRLEAQRRIRGRWREEPGRRRQRVYAITPSGTSLLAEQRESWLALIGSLKLILAPKEARA
jgi:DNA-binding PadR family transcriptional regulator